jgi:predicted amidohydrolase
MKIGVAQLKPFKGNIKENLISHINLIKLAAEKGTKLLVFPELSLTGYELHLSKSLALTIDDERLNILQHFADRYQMIIGVGAPTIKGNDINISTILFQPKKNRISYAKQNLYGIENNFFIAGNEDVIISLNENNKVAFAICYDISDTRHSIKAKQNGATIYIASVLDSVEGINSDLQKLSAIAKSQNLIVLMANFIGSSGGYNCAGTSTVWDTSGTIIGQLDPFSEAILVFNTTTNTII